MTTQETQIQTPSLADQVDTLLADMQQACDRLDAQLTDPPQAEAGVDLTAAVNDGGLAPADIPCAPPDVPPTQADSLEPDAEAPAPQLPPAEVLPELATAPSVGAEVEPPARTQLNSSHRPNSGDELSSVVDEMVSQATQAAPTPSPAPQPAPAEPVSESAPLPDAPVAGPQHVIAPPVAAVAEAPPPAPAPVLVEVPTAVASVPVPTAPSAPSIAPSVPPAPVVVRDRLAAFKRLSATLRAKGTALARLAEPHALKLAALISKPILSRPKHFRDTLGWVSSYTMFLGAGLWGYLIFVYSPAAPVPVNPPVHLADSTTEHGGAGEVVRHGLPKPPESHAAADAHAEPAAGDHGAKPDAKADAKKKPKKPPAKKPDKKKGSGSRAEAPPSGH